MRTNAGRGEPWPGLRELDPAAFAAGLDALMGVYQAAMGVAAVQIPGRRTIMEAHAANPDFRALAVTAPPGDGTVIAFAYGFHGGRGFTGARTFVGARPFVSGPHVFVRSGFHGVFPRAHVFRHCYRPRTFVRFGFGVGFPRYYHYYQPPAVVYERDVEPEHVAPAPMDDDDFDVTNLPPLGCYYYDRYCDQRFATLDDYTEHLEHRHHAGTIAIIDRKSGDRLRTLEFVDHARPPAASRCRRRSSRRRRAGSCPRTRASSRTRAPRADRRAARPP